MLKNLNVLLFVILFQVTSLYAQDKINQTDAKGYKQGNWIVKFPNGKVRYEGSYIDNKPVGDWKRFHENGIVKARMTYLPNSDKVAAELFEINGTRYAKGIYKGTTKDSTWNYYNNLRLVGQEDYAGGVKSGRSVIFYGDGSPATESFWLNGQPDGVSRSFYPSGKKKTEIMFRAGKREGLSLVYYESGQTEVTGQYVNDLCEGSWKFNLEDGKLIYELKYKSGVLLNPEIIDTLQNREFKAFDQARGRIKDPADFTQSPEEYLRK